MLEMDGDIPWDTLTFVIGQINYGGRVTDDWDRRCLMTMLSKYISPKVLDSDYVFSPSGQYRVPEQIDGKVADVVQYVETMPLSEDPEVFGLHENANISFQRQESDRMLETVLSIQPREGGGAGGKRPEDIVLEMCADQETKVPDALTSEVAHPSTFAMFRDSGLMNSLGTCLTQEMTRFNQLLDKLRSTLKQLQRAIQGLIVMTGDLDSMFTSMQNNQVPEVWKSVAYPSLKPLTSWFVDMVERVDFMRGWVTSGVPLAYWVSAFFFPQGFLTAVLQGYSRENAIPVDILSFEYIVQEFDDPGVIEEQPERGMYIYGLFFDGCTWDFDEMVLADQEYGQMYSSAPAIHFLPCENYKPDPAQYSCPLYKTSVRAGTLSTTGHSTNFVLTIEMDTAEEVEYWVLKGAALLTMLND
jgi:dynein heavy chain